MLKGNGLKVAHFTILNDLGLFDLSETDLNGVRFGLGYALSPF